MKITGRYIALALGAACFVPVGRPASAMEADPPYTVIASRNIFGLMPVPTNNPTEDAAAQANLPKITPNGIMNIFGKVQVLFKVAVKPVTGQPNNGNKDDSYVMCVGERQDEIEVVKIDEAASIVTFNNHGTVQELPLVAASPTGPGAGPSGPGGPGGRGGNPGFAPHFTPGKGGGLAAPMGMDNHGQRGMTGGGNPGSTGMPSLGGAVVHSQANPQEEALTPEAQVIMMEAQRAKWQTEENSPSPAIIPPTPLTDQNTPPVPE